MQLLAGVSIALTWYHSTIKLFNQNDLIVKKSKPLSLLLTFILLAGFSWQLSYAQTQPDIRLESVDIYLLPEYNQPYVFVIHEITLAESVRLPQNLIFEIPADAEVIRVINYTSDDRPIELNYQVSQIGNWKDLLLTPNSRSIHIEYQDPNLVRQGNKRLFEFRWLALYPVSSLSITVRQPLGASSILSEPPLDELEVQNENIRYYAAHLGPIPAGELLNLSLEYTKIIGDLTSPALPVEPAVPIEADVASGTPSPLMVVLWLMVVIVAATIIVWLYYWWFKANVNVQSERLLQGVGIMNPEKQFYFCHECGIRTKLGDRFCSNCGTELHKPTSFENLPRE